MGQDKETAEVTASGTQWPHPPISNLVPRRPLYQGVLKNQEKWSRCEKMQTSPCFITKGDNVCLLA